MKILVIRLSSIGDIIVTTPVLRSLREKYPDAQIDFVVMDKFKESLVGNKSINNLIIFEREKYKSLKKLIEFSKQLRVIGYDLVIDLHAKMRSTVISRFCGAKKILRYKKRFALQSLLINMRVIKNKYSESIVRKYYKPLKEIGIEYVVENIEFDYSEKDKLKPSRIKERTGDYIVFAPGASKETKKWPKEYFSELGKMLVEDLNKSIVLIGGKNEWNELEFIRNEIGERCYNAAGELNLKESGALLAGAEFAVTNDSGPFHIARGVKALVFVIFGPTDPNMFEYNKKSILIYGNEPCSSCSLHGDKVCPKKHFNCMKNITPENLMKKIKETV